MRILNVTAQKPDSTGSGVYLAQLVRCQVEAGHEAAVVCGVAAGDEAALPAGVPVRPVRFETDALPFPVCGMSDEMPYRSTRYRDLTPGMAERFERAFAAALAEMDEAFRPDVVICHHLYLLTAIARELLPHRPMGAVCHSTDLRQMATHGLARERIVADVRGLDVVLALHEEQKRQIERVYGVDPGRVQVVGTGYDAATFSREGRALGAGPLAEGRPAELVYVGKIARKKGLLSLLEAFDAMDAPAGARLRLVGGAGDAAEHALICERARACRRPAELLGRKAPAEVARICRGSDVFVLPSFYEGLPLVTVEALACGCSVVMTDLPGVRPWLDERIPGAPVSYVEPPRMEGIDEPAADDLPAFERRLARALEDAVARPPRFCDTEGACWERLSERILSHMERAAAAREC
ncbi:glycosyltransferase family 4 protein [Arabiibacter massiliensis]|uniref:glycosyltransferase family 4 protein n=1 Tax=Arabiibacter massiliensis TaxID=1870985 RepID=UPI0009BC4EE3|nr:glycosyltransferase family 4 protein [Arabiibacter massiliensis]